MPALDMVGGAHDRPMTRPRYQDIQNTPLPTDVELIPHLQKVLEGGYRRQFWVTLLDAELRPLPLLIPGDLPLEPEFEERQGFSEFFTCLALDFPGCTLVLTFERPGPEVITTRDRRWLRIIRESLVDTGQKFRGPYLLLGSSVRQVAPDEYLSTPLLEVEEW
jgi:hypothetical protein